MNPAVQPHRRSHWWWWLLASAGGVVATCLTPASVRIVQTGALEGRPPANAIVVFGAAEYSGHPSPVYRARLDHAFTLYQRGLAPVIITTGGAGGDPKFSECGGRRPPHMGR